MAPTEGSVPLLTQVEQARIAYLEACDAAAAISLEHGELKARVGGNETERKAAMKRTTQEEYDGWLIQFAAIDTKQSDAIAYRNRCEKSLNTLRDMLSNETASVERETALLNTQIIQLRAEVAETERITAQLLSATADVQARRAGTRITMQEIRNSAAGMCPDCGKSMALDIHEDCVPF